jgi:hypothetical protein
MYITIAIAGGCGLALVVVALVIVRRAQKSKAVSSSPRGADGKAVVPHFAIGGVSSNNPSFVRGLPEAHPV